MVVKRRQSSKRKRRKSKKRKKRRSRNAVTYYSGKSFLSWIQPSEEEKFHSAKSLSHQDFITYLRKPFVPSIYYSMGAKPRDSIQAKKSILEENRFQSPVPLNHECKKTNWRECNLGRDYFTRIQFGQKIGSGGYGQVYEATGRLSDGGLVNLAIKTMELPDTRQNVEDSMTEVEYAVFMSSLGIGPKVYGARWLRLTRPKRFIQVITMDRYDLDCGEAITEFSIRHQFDKIEPILFKMVGLLKKQMNQGLLCVDVKPNNYIYKKDTQEVRMIDFGSYFCKYDKRDFTPKFLLLLCQISLMSQYFVPNISSIKKKYMKKIRETFAKRKAIYSINQNSIDEMLYVGQRNKLIRDVLVHYTGISPTSERNIKRLLREAFGISR